MNPAQQDTIGELLSAYLDGEVSAEQTAQVEALLESDAEARAMLAELEQAARSVRDLPRGAAPPSVLEGITSRAERDELLGAPADEVRLERHRRSPFRSSFAVAALLLVAVTAALYVSYELSRTPAPPGEPLVRRDAPSPLPNGTKQVPRAGQDAGEEHAGHRGRGLDQAAALDERKTQRGLEAFNQALSIDEVEHPATLRYAADTTTEEARAAGSEATGTRESQSGVTDGGPALADRSAPYDDAMTLEQKLAAGQVLAALATHRFDNEPLQLTVTFATPARQEAFNDLLKRFFAECAARPTGRFRRIGDAATSAAFPGMTDSSVGATVSPAESGTVIFEGDPDSNFTPRVAGERRYLARLPAAVVGELIKTVSDTDVERIQLGIGMLTAEGADGVRYLAGQALGADADANEEAEPVIAEGGMMELLRKTGLAPPGVVPGVRKRGASAAGEDFDADRSAKHPADRRKSARDRDQPLGEETASPAVLHVDTTALGKREIGPPPDREAGAAPPANPFAANDAPTGKTAREGPRPEAPAPQLITLVIRMVTAAPPSPAEVATQPASAPSPRE